MSEYYSDKIPRISTCPECYGKSKDDDTMFCDFCEGTGIAFEYYDPELCTEYFIPITKVF